MDMLGYTTDRNMLHKYHNCFKTTLYLKIYSISNQNIMQLNKNTCFLTRILQIQQYHLAGGGTELDCFVLGEKSW